MSNDKKAAVGNLAIGNNYHLRKESIILNNYRVQLIVIFNFPEQFIT